MHETPSSLFAAAVRARRRELGLTRRQLAEQAGLHPATISSVENMLASPTLATAGLIAGPLGLVIEVRLAGEAEAVRA